MKREDCGGNFQRVADPKGWMSVAARDEELVGKLERWMEGEIGLVGSCGVWAMRMVVGEWIVVLGIMLGFCESNVYCVKV